MDDHDRELDDWRHYIGRAILAFAEIEFISLKFLTHVPRDKIIDGVQHLAFARRIDLIIEILESRAKPPKAAREFLPLLRSAKDLAKYRNVLAHNPVMWQVFANEAGDEQLVERAIFSARAKDKFLDLPGLKELTGEVEDLISPLYMQLMNIFAEMGEAEAKGENADA